MLAACFDGLASVVALGANGLAELGDCVDELFVFLGCLGAPVALCDVGTDGIEHLGFIDEPDFNGSGCVAYFDFGRIDSDDGLLSIEAVCGEGLHLIGSVGW